MSESKKPREFWLAKHKTKNYYIANSTFEELLFCDELEAPFGPFIEKQAYNDLKDRFKQEMINRGAEESYHENIQQVELIFKGDD